MITYTSMSPLEVDFRINTPVRCKGYEFEDIREFLIRRQFLIDQFVGSAGAWDSIKNRKFHFTKPQANYLRAFIDGWNQAKGK